MMKCHMIIVEILLTTSYHHKWCNINRDKSVGDDNKYRTTEEQSQSPS